MVSRFRARQGDQAGARRTPAAGKVDILIGTHRLLSKDVVFRDLGLLVIDEEQRFGVAAKEKLKQLRTTVDCLTLSATPIPRTLQMGLAGIRDMSVIETPPKDRLAIQTSIVKFSTDVIAAAIRQELARDGQVYFVHNRVESIYSLASLVQQPGAGGAGGGGPRPDAGGASWRRSMLAFVEGRADVLVATTIIENGLDIPRANTMIVNRADRYGLAQLYQLRGRVGRSDRRAYAYLLVPPGHRALRDRAQAPGRHPRVLRAGRRLPHRRPRPRAARRGQPARRRAERPHRGGGPRPLREAAGADDPRAEGRGRRAEAPRATLNLRVDLRIPEDYVPEVHQRMSLYKRVSQVRDAAEVDAPARGDPRPLRRRCPPEVDGAPALRRRCGCAREALGVAAGRPRRAAPLHLRLAPEHRRSRGGRWRPRPRACRGAALVPQGVLRAPVAAPRTPLLGPGRGSWTALEARRRRRA